MAPKPAPKLTKKQIEELKKEELRKKEAEQKQRKEEQQARLQERMRLDELQRKKRAEEERVRIVVEKEKYRQIIDSRVKDQNAAADRLDAERKWNSLTEEYHKSFDTAKPNISTFVNVFKEEKYQNPQRTLKSCEEAEMYAKHMGYAMLHSRALKDNIEQKYYADSIIRLRKIEMQKFERIMIDMANSAQEMEEKNNQINKKGQPNKKLEGVKILEYQQHHSRLAKIGMFLNSSTTKNLNKFRPIQIKEFGLNTQIPSKWMNANTIVKFQWVNYNPLSPEVFERFLLIGGVYILQFYELLLGSKKINNIVLKKYYKDNQVLQKFKLPTNIIKQPFNVAYQIPKYVFLHTFDQSTLRLAQFDFSTNKWAMLPNDTVIEYDPVQKKATCRLFRPEPIAYVQQRCTDYPYVAWELRSIQSGKALLDIELKRWKLQKEGEQKRRFMIKFQIDAYSIRLVSDENYPQLQDLTTGSWSPSAILYELSQRGIHLLPIDEDYEDAKIPVKDRSAQQNAIRDIAYALEAFYIRSEVNDSNDIIVKIRENLQFQRVFLQDQEKDWKKIRWLSGNRCEVSNRNIQERHLNLEILLQQHNFCLSECLDRIKFDKNYLFKKNVMEVLSLTRILSFSSNTAEESHLRWTLKERQLVKL